MSAEGPPEAVAGLNLSSGDTVLRLSFLKSDIFNGQMLCEWARKCYEIQLPFPLFLLPNFHNPFATIEGGPDLVFHGGSPLWCVSL